MYDMAHAYVRHDIFTRITHHTWALWFVDAKVLMFPRIPMMSIYIWAMTRAYVYHKATCRIHICVTWLANLSFWKWAREMITRSLAKKILIQMRDMTLRTGGLHVCARVCERDDDKLSKVLSTPPRCTVSYVWHDSFTCVTWLLCMCDMTPLYVWCDSITCMTWLIHMCDITPLYVWCDSFTCATWFIYMCEMTHSYVWKSHSYLWHGSIICATWLIYICDMTHSYVRHV